MAGDDTRGRTGEKTTVRSYYFLIEAARGGWMAKYAVVLTCRLPAMGDNHGSGERPRLTVTHDHEVPRSAGEKEGEEAV